MPDPLLVCQGPALGVCMHGPGQEQAVPAHAGGALLPVAAEHAGHRCAHRVGACMRGRTTGHTACLSAWEVGGVCGRSQGTIRRVGVGAL